MSITCRLCGLTYMPDEEADQKQHRERHARVSEAMYPDPDARFAKQIVRTDGRPLFVCCRSPDWVHEATHNRSLAFANEVPCGVTAWPRDGTIMPVECHCYLFADDTQTLPFGAIAGACGFSDGKYADGSPGRLLEWIWLCPAVRRKGVLARQWAWLKEENGNFGFQPVTEAMQRFAIKHQP
jgi:zinc-finger of acetyl-transferase ESCO